MHVIKISCHVYAHIYSHWPLKHLLPGFCDYDLSFSVSPCMLHFPHTVWHTIWYTQTIQISFNNCFINAASFTRNILLHVKYASTKSVKYLLTFKYRNHSLIPFNFVTSSVHYQHLWPYGCNFPKKQSLWSLKQQLSLFSSIHVRLFEQNFLPYRIISKNKYEHTAKLNWNVNFCKSTPWRYKSF